LFTLYDYTVLHTNIDSRKWNDDSAEIIGDSGASAIIFNLANIHLATELVAREGAIEGAADTQLGAIKYEGFTELMVVRMPCYVADISKSVVAIGLLMLRCSFYGKIYASLFRA
jgi:hypothetical protein